jgi:flagellar protein FlgJ
VSPSTHARSASVVSARVARPLPTHAATTASAAGDAATPNVPANVRSFVDRMRPFAEAAARAVGVPADLLLAQAGLETGWGRSQPKTTDGTASHNLFGIKAGRGWNGAVSVASTTEYVAGAIVRTVDKFRSYASYTDAFQDFGRLLTRSGRYASAVAQADDPVAYAKGLQRGGYATDPQYADKLLRALKLVAAHGTGAPAQVMAQSAVNRTDEAVGGARNTT